MSVVKRGNPLSKRAEASHLNEPARTTALRGISDEVAGEEAFDAADPEVEEKKK